LTTPEEAFDVRTSKGQDRDVSETHGNDQEGGTIRRLVRLIGPVVRILEAPGGRRESGRSPKCTEDGGKAMRRNGARGLPPSASVPLKGLARDASHAAARPSGGMNVACLPLRGWAQRGGAR